MKRLIPLICILWIVLITMSCSTIEKVRYFSPQATGGEGSWKNFRCIVHFSGQKDKLNFATEEAEVNTFHQNQSARVIFWGPGIIIPLPIIPASPFYWIFGEPEKREQISVAFELLGKKTKKSFWSRASYSNVKGELIPEKFIIRLPSGEHLSPTKTTIYRYGYSGEKVLSPEESYPFDTKDKAGFIVIFDYNLDPNELISFLFEPNGITFVGAQHKFPKIEYGIDSSVQLIVYPLND